MKPLDNSSTMEGIYPERKICKRSLLSGVGSSSKSRLGDDLAARDFIAALIGKMGIISFAKGTKITIYCPMWTITFRTRVFKRATRAMTPSVKLETITSWNNKGLTNTGS